MDVIDVKQKREAAAGRYKDAVALADDFFGADRIMANGRGFVGSGTYFYVDGKIEQHRVESGIEVRLTDTTFLTISVRNQSYLEEAKRFGEAYEAKFDDSRVLLEHNLR